MGPLRFRARFAAVIVAGGAALTLGAVPALATTHAKAVPETAYGAVSGRAAAADVTVIPLTWRGLVNTHSVFTSGSNDATPRRGQTYDFATSAGNFWVVITANPRQSQTSNLRTCQQTFTLNVPFAATDRSTGQFEGTTGNGNVRFFSSGYGPRYTSGPKAGQCNTSPNAPELSKGAIATFLLSATLRR